MVPIHCSWLPAPTNLGHVAWLRTGGSKVGECKLGVKRPLDAVHLCHSFDCPFSLSMGSNNAANALARCGRGTVVQDRVLVTLAMEWDPVCVVRLPKDAVRPNSMRCDVVCGLDCDVHAESAPMRGTLGHGGADAPLRGCHDEMDFLPVFEVHIVNVHVEPLGSAVEGGIVGIKAKLEQLSLARLNSPVRMTNPASLHPHL